MKAMRQLTAVCVAGAALVAGTVCAAAQTAPAPAAPGRGPVPTAHRVVLADQDTGRALTARPGDEIEVRLTGVRDRGTTFAWSQPVSGAPAVLRRSAAGTTPTGSATGRFTAAGRGTAALTARRTCHAAPGARCPHVVVVWKVTVTVR
ncbi:hypothetical protein ACFXPZ_07065 [Streptomyces sp. NPDC059101]|uniref:hypothetical protein n=1 Tax=unclassified Streptomyces TaxID=2593676 RepID=UPI000C26DFA3|nr:hypothetical protein [Streptomyces sp. CB02959]PJN40381.1 hypothetical protein CG747_11890 [Streptomyces sp. CB02959]